MNSNFCNSVWKDDSQHLRKTCELSGFSNGFKRFQICIVYKPNFRISESLYCTGVVWFCDENMRFNLEFKRKTKQI